MGYSIHYQFNAGDRPINEIRTILHSLHHHAQLLPFTRVDDNVIELEGKDCVFSSENKKSSLLTLQAINHNFATGESISPTHIIGFETLPRPGCESLAIFLGYYSQYKNWMATGHCKTQFASLPEYGGDANFVFAHTLVVEMLDRVQSLGILENVYDEIGYWQQRDLLCLVERDSVEFLRQNIVQLLPNSSSDFVQKLQQQIDKLNN
ncbi:MULTISPECIES: hypothetical protein [Nostocales]|uniref:Uncharacterized protein n=3 Tax=Nostocales TaxID=1161 RepID=A0A8S9T099_9CYAN|nr:hypothetical protein [Tolypothrix bouteillei]KAF3885124.1 hypothetical protein DA73_0400006335 [Tolypothrix bouteillei VB521301]